MTGELGSALRLTSAEARLDDRAADLVLRYSAEGRFETEAFVPTESALDELGQSARELRADAEALPDSIVRGHLRDLSDGLDAASVDDRRHPERFLAGLVRFVTAQVWEERRSRRRRVETLRARLAPSSDLFAAVESLARRGGVEPAQGAAEAARSLALTLDRAAQAVAGWSDAADATTVVETLGSVATAARRLAAQVEQVDGNGGGEPVPSLPYEELLRRRHGVELSELLAWHREEIDACAERLRALAAAIDPAADPVALLWERSPAYPSPTAMFEAARECLAVARTRSLSLISLPPGEVCRVSPIPELIQASYPWGGAYGPSPARGLLWGKWYLNQANYRAVTRGWVQMMAIHECYPGHHAHRVKAVAGDLPRAFKLGRLAGTTPLSEGIAHRAETQLQHIFDDPVFPVFVAYRRLHTAVRIEADLMLHHWGRPRGEAVALYQRHLGFDEGSASGQVRYQELHPGYMTCYYYGCRQLERWQSELGLPDPAFTETTFSAGWVSLATMRRLLVARATAPPGDERAG